MLSYLKDLVLRVLGLFLDVGNDGSDSFDDGDDQRAKRGGAGVIEDRGGDSASYRAGADG